MIAEQSTELPPPTAPDLIDVRLIGFDDEEYAKGIGNNVAETIRLLSRYIDAEYLDGITISFDYPKALLELDRGDNSLNKLTPTCDDLSVGIAMSPAVLRGAKVKVHIVLNACIVCKIVSNDEDEIRTTVNLLAHELGHVQDIKFRNIAFPETILRETIKNSRAGFLYHIAEACWCEYAATRVSASIHPRQIVHYEELFITNFQLGASTINKEILSYRTHGNIDALLTISVKILGNILKYASYMLGQINGVNGIFSDLAPEAHRTITDTKFESIFRKLEQSLIDMHKSYGSWTDMSIWDNLSEVSGEYLCQSGIILKDTSAGKLYVEVPYTPGTMPY